MTGCLGKAHPILLRSLKYTTAHQQAGWNRCWELGHIWSPVSSKNQKREMLGCWADLLFKVNECKRQVTRHHHWTVGVHLLHKHAPTHVNYTLPSICRLLCSSLWSDATYHSETSSARIRSWPSELEKLLFKLQDTFSNKSKQTIVKVFLWKRS